MKKQSIGLLILLLVWSSFSFASDWGQCALTAAPLIPNGNEMILEPSGGTDDPQPDTLFYDSGVGMYLLYGGTNLYCNERFTPPVEFELRSVYIMPLNAFNNTTDDMTIYVKANNGGVPGAILARIMIPHPIPGAYQWVTPNLETPITFQAGEDFHIMYSSPAGSYPGGGWYPYFDGDPITYNRTTYSSGPNGPWIAVPYDALIRAGGQLAGTYLDLSTVSVFNQQAKFFFEAGTPVNLKARVDNIGLLDAEVYTFKWEVKTEAGTLVWTFESAYTNLAAGVEVVLSADSAWTPSLNGYYIVYGTVTHPDDADPSNNTALLEQGINSLGVWYRYDDGDGAVNFSFSAGDAIGSGFTPAFFPISVDTVAVNLNTAGNCNVKLYQLDGAGGAPNTQLWSTTSTLVSGWNYFVTGGVDVFEDGFAVVVEPNADITIVMDDEAPIAATNMDMPVVAWVNQAGWQNWGSGDLLLRGYITESSAIPPFPVLDLSADTIYFDSTAVGDTATYALWMYNIGGLDPLIINNIVLNPTNPPNIFTRISGTLPITIQAGDSCEVDFRFVPPSVGNFLTVMGIQNNATPPMVLVPIYGTGTEPAFVYGDQRPLPTYYSLGQNQPNPFNPSTTINFTLPQAGKVELAVYNVLGAKILTLVNGDLNAGYHLVKFDATKLCSGIYFYRLTAGNFTDMKKMVLMK